jgi:hypothetical protein
MLEYFTVFIARMYQRLKDKPINQVSLGVYSLTVRAWILTLAHGFSYPSRMNSSNSSSGDWRPESTEDARVCPYPPCCGAGEEAGVEPGDDSNPSPPPPMGGVFTD